MRGLTLSENVPHKNLHRLGHDELPALATGQLSRSGFQSREERVNPFMSSFIDRLKQSVTPEAPLDGIPKAQRQWLQ